MAMTSPAALHGGPFGFMRRFAEEMDHLFDEFGMGAGMHIPSAVTRGREMLRRESGLVPADWSPRVDVLRREGQIVFRADLPGMSKDDIKVEVKDNALTLQGERKHAKKEEREGYFYSECSHGCFYRALPLPEGADASKATAEFHNGVLEVAIPMPKQAETQTRRVEVREKK
jgi:HSP20 family protein